jgi:glycosidase
MYYGTEILMKGFSNPDGLVRSDFEGGWKSDKQDRFTEMGRNDAENRTFTFIKQLAKWRKKTTAVQNGKTLQFIPELGMYVYFRYDNRSKVMVIINTEKPNELKNLAKYDEILNGMRLGTDAISGQSIDLNALKLAPWDFRIIEIK